MQQPLAYVFWHWPRADVARDAYERAMTAFHHGLHRADVPGFRDSTTFRVSALPWAPDGGAGYEDWYVLDGFAALGSLNQAAVSEAGDARTRHDRAADAAEGGAGGLYSVRAGNPRLTEGVACWFAKPAGMTYQALDELLDAVVAPQRGSCLWQRELVLGPGREFCLVAPSRLPLPPELDVVRVTRAPLPDTTT